MKESGKYRLPYRNLSLGEHTYSFQLDNAFFAQFQDALIDRGKIDLVVRLTKGHMSGSLQLDHEGLIETTCDRCLEEIELPIEGSMHLLIRHADEAMGEEEDILLVDETSGALDLNEAIYDYVSLSVPMIKSCDQQTPCNSEILDRLRPKQDKMSDTAWDELKNLKL